MQWDEITQSWTDVKRQIRLRWSKLSDVDLEQSGGERDRIVERIEHYYCVRKENIERELDTLVEKL
jgi:uncharacterized protein YjbJ (UPF0337 family)